MSVEKKDPFATYLPEVHYEDIPVACTSSGAVYLFLNVVEGDQHSVSAIRQRLLKGEKFFRGLPCASCRTIVSRDHRTEKQNTCEYRLLRGPLFVPRQPGG